MSYTSVERVEHITTCDVGTVIAVHERGACAYRGIAIHERGAYSYRGLLLPRGPVERTFLAGWAERGPGEYTLQFDREWGCIGATPVARSNP